MPLSANHENILKLIRLGIGTSKDAKISKEVDWAAIKALVDRHGLSAVVLDGIDKLNTNLSNSSNNLPLAVKLEWIGEVLQNYEQRYKSYEQAIGSLASFYNSHGFKMMVLKGYACGLDWPKREHRPYGDIDVWLFGKQKEADATLAKEKGLLIDSSHHHHTVFTWSDFSVENHYDFCHVHHHKSNVELERIFKELGMVDGQSIEVNNEIIYLPSANLHALFLMKHSMTDFAAFNVTLRQVLDWGFFVEKRSNEIDWEWLIAVLKKFHMIEFFNCINAICVDDLGFESNVFPYVQFNPLLKDKVLSDILVPKFTREEPKFLIYRLLFKFRRWKGNAWKHELCYNESMWSAFWSGIWNHFLKPSSI